MNEVAARYILIGGFAVIAHGATRFTKDIDLLIDDAPENVARVKRGLSVLADNAAADIADTDVHDHVVVRVADEVIIDLMGKACGLSCADVVSDAEVRVFDGVSIPVAGPAALIRTKDMSRSGNIPVTAEQIGAGVRQARLAQGLRQDQLAAAAGVGVRFLVELERGKPTVRLSKVLAVLDALACRLEVTSPHGTAGSGS